MFVFAVNYLLQRLCAETVDSAAQPGDGIACVWICDHLARSAWLREKMDKLIRLVSRGDEVIGLDGISSAHAANGRKGERKKNDEISIHENC